MKPMTLKILEHQRLSDDAYLLRLEKPEWTWKPGQLVGVTGKKAQDQRDYSIASGPEDDSLDIVYRLIPHGAVTPYLVNLVEEEALQVTGPYGRFTLRDLARPMLFCATGTGIAPCRSYLRSFPELKLTLLHGVRYQKDLYFRDEFEGRCQYLPFCSREDLDGSSGRITDALKEMELPEGAQAYLCGANEMIYEAEEILNHRGISHKDIFREPYYYRAYDN